jgi:NADH dehydrogenase
VPVVVTGASGAVGRTLLPLLIGRGSEVRAVIRAPAAAEELRGMGAKVAVIRFGDADTLEAVMEGAHTVVHLAGGLAVPDDAYEEANLETTRSVLEAATERKVPRFLFLSYPGASPDAPNPYLRAKGMAEEEIRASGLQHVILRSTHVYGPRCRWLEEMLDVARRPVAVVVGSGKQRLAPTFVDDVARVLAAADDRAVEVAGTFGLQGPDELSADELVDLLAGRAKRKVHLGPDAARMAARLAGRRLSPALVEVLAADSTADAPDAAAEFGVPLTPLVEGLAASR